MTVRDGIAYVAASGDSGHEGTTILDVRDAEQPRVIAQMPAPEGTPGHSTAFRDWFYRTPSVGLAGRFSNLGHFTHNAGPLCT